VSGINTAEWIQIVSIFVLATVAIAAPYIAERLKYTYRAPKLRIKFKLAAPGCHQTQLKSPTLSLPVYYFRFLVENFGKTQAEECEVLLEKIFKENGAGNLMEFDNFTPVNLKWSGIRNPIERTIQPSREVYCDLGRLQHPNHPYLSKFSKITSNEQKMNKFAFELPDVYYSQWDCLVPGKYKLIVSAYSKNANKVTREFHVFWTGEWRDEDKDMFRELVIK
jgi:hypothetical protein